MLSNINIRLALVQNPPKDHNYYQLCSQDVFRLSHLPYECVSGRAIDRRGFYPHIFPRLTHKCFNGAKREIENLTLLQCNRSRSNISFKNQILKKFTNRQTDNESIEHLHAKFIAPAPCVAGGGGGGERERETRQG